MSNKLMLRKAERKQAKLKIGIFGPSGSGKTMSALKLARGMVEWDKVVVIDTENNSADLYSHLGEYNVLTIEAPFTPEKYIEAIKACEDSGMEVIIIDSITHEWAGTGGILEMIDDLGKAIKNSMQVWAKLTPRHNKFITSILESPAHVICCGRSKQDYVMNQVEKNGKIINVPEKIGLKAVTREGFDYEMTISFDLAINHYADTSKDRTGLFMGRPGFIISEETGKEMMEWNSSGKVDVLAKKQEIMKQLKRIGINISSATKEQLEADVLSLSGLALVDKNFEKIITILRKTPAMDPATSQKNNEQKEIDKEKDKAKQITPGENKDTIKSFQIKTIRQLAKSKINNDDEETIKTFMMMFGLEYEKLESMTIKQGNMAIKFLEAYSNEADEETKKAKA